MGVGIGLYLYFVLDVIPDPKHHNPENGLRRESKTGSSGYCPQDPQNML